MNVLIEMSVEVYDSLLDKCDQSCAEYYTLTVTVWKDDRFRALFNDHRERHAEGL